MATRRPLTTHGRCAAFRKHDGANLICGKSQGHTTSEHPERRWHYDPDHNAYWETETGPVGDGEIPAQAGTAISAEYLARTLDDAHAFIAPVLVKLHGRADGGQALNAIKISYSMTGFTITVDRALYQGDPYELYGAFITAAREINDRADYTVWGFSTHSGPAPERLRLSLTFTHARYLSRTTAYEEHHP